MKSPRVLLIGPQWFGDLLAFCERGLIDLGADVRVIATNDARWVQYPSRMHRALAVTPIVGPDIDRRLYTRHLKRQRAAFNRRVRETVTEWQPDLLLAILCWEEVISREFLDSLPSMIKVGWLMDDPFQSSLQKVLASFDSLYVVDESWIAPIQLLTGRGAAMLPCGGDLQSYHPLGWDQVPAAARCEVAFVGTSYSAKPEGLVRRTLLRQIADLGLSIYGDKGWAACSSRDDPLPGCYRGGELTSEQANLVYNAASIALNIHHSQFRAGTSLRTFAICAAGAFQLVDWRPGLDRYFIPDKEVVVYRSPGELREKALYYLANETARRRIARAGYRRVEREHTYGHRIRNILQDMDLSWGLSSAALFRLAGKYRLVGR